MNTLEKIILILECIDPDTPEHLPIIIPNDITSLKFTLANLRELVEMAVQLDNWRNDWEDE